LTVVDAADSMTSDRTPVEHTVTMEEAILAIEWPASTLGDPSAWPQSLKSIVALILASGKPMFIVWGPEQTLLYNDAYVPLLGQKHPQALGKPFFSVWPDAEGDLRPLFERLFGGSVVELDDISISFDRQDESSDHHFALSYTPIRDHGNRVVGLLCIHSETSNFGSPKVPEPRDHTRLDQLFELAPSVIAVLNGPERRIELANAGFWKLVGERKIIGKSFVEAFPDALNQGYISLLDDCFRRGERVMHTGAQYSVAGAALGAERFIDFVFQPISDGIGNVTGIFVQGADVTERVRGERMIRDRETHLHEENADLGRLVTERSEQLQAKEALIQAVYDHSSECHIVVVEESGGEFRLQEMNPAALSLYRTTSEQVIGCTIDECLGRDQAATVNAQLTACLEADAPYECEFAYEGTIIEGVASPLPAVRGIGRQIAISARNVAERRSLEEQLRQSQKMEAVGQLTGGLAHDFNNLLTGITGALEILKKRMTEGRSSEADYYIGAAQAAAQRAAALTHRLLAFARRQPLDPKSIRVDGLVAGMNELIQRTVGPGIRVAIVDAIEPWNAWVDPNQLENALLNLCINARDAMPSGGDLLIKICNHEFDQGTTAEHDLSVGQYLSLCVRDTGTGMSAAVIGKAFEPLFTTKPIGEGTGLGLSMVYGFARQSGGHVRIDSEIGVGTQVWIYLPRHRGALVDADESLDSKAASPAGSV